MLPSHRNRNKFLVPLSIPFLKLGQLTTRRGITRRKITASCNTRQNVNKVKKGSKIGSCQKTWIFTFMYFLIKFISKSEIALITVST